MYLKRLLWLFFFSTYSLITYGATQENYSAITTPSFSTIDEKLYTTKMATRAIVQDEQGYLWVGTTEGLYRYDGYQMTLYRHQNDNENSLLDNHIEDLLVDPNGFLWIATRYNGLSRLDTRTNKFLHFSEQSELAKQLSSNTLYEIKGTKSGLWIATENGVNFIHYTNLTVSQFLVRQEPIQVISLAVDQQENIWFGTSKGLLFKDKISPHINPVSDSFPSITIKEIFIAEDNSLWLGTSYDGHWRYFPSTQTLVAITDGLISEQTEQKKADANSFLQVSSQEIWLATSAKGIEVRNAQSGQLINRIKHDSAISYSLLPSAVSTLFKDKSGLIWVGNMHAGLQFYNPSNTAFSIASASPNKTAGLSGSPIDAILTLSDDTLLLSIASNLNIDVIKPNKGKIDSLKLTVNFEEKPRQLNILTMVEAKDKQVWMGSFPAYLSRYNPKTKQVKHFKVPLKKQRQGAILDMIEDRETGSLWLAMSEGLLRFDTNSNNFEVIEHNFNGPLRLIYQDSEGNIWTGNKKGLYVRRKLDQQWFTFNSQSHPSFIDHSVEGILVDSQNRAWIGTKSNFYRLFSWFDQEATFTSVNSRLGRQDAGANNIIEDNKGRIWLSLDRYFDPNDWTFHPLSHVEKQDLTAFKGSYHKNYSDVLFFGGAKGLLMINPEKIMPWHYQPPLVLTQIKIDQQQQPLHTHSLFMPAGTKSFSVNFSAIDFTEPSNLMYRYKLIGYDEKWIETDAQQRVATYTSLAPGNYILEISAKNRANIWSASPLTLNIVVEPNYYQTWWFRSLLVLSSLLLIYGFIKLRVKQISHQEHIKNEMILISERADMMAELVEKKNQLLADVSHELRTPLTILQLKVEALQHNLVKDVNASYDSLQTKIADINKLITDIHQLAQSDIGALQLNVTTCNIVSSINHWSRELAEIAEVKGFQWQQKISLPPSLSMGIDQDKIKQVLHNIVNNSTTYTNKPGKIRFIASLSNQQLTLKIEDTSPGVSSDHLPKLFERLFRVESSRSRSTGGSGLGLAICKSIIEAHQGEISSSASKLGGLAILITLPLKPTS